MFDEKFESLEQETDPIKILRDSSFLLAVNQQLAVEISRRRKVAVDVAADEIGMTYGLIAAKARLTKGRIGQIRKTAPPEERIVFGYGPLNEIRVTRLKPDPIRGVPINDALMEGARHDFYKLMERLNLQVFEWGLQRSRLSSMYADSFTIVNLEKHLDVPEVIEQDPNVEISYSKNGEVQLYRRCSRGVEKKLIKSYFGKFWVGENLLFIIVGQNEQALTDLVKYLDSNLYSLYKSVGAAEFSITIENSAEKSTQGEEGNITINKVSSDLL